MRKTRGYKYVQIHGIYRLFAAHGAAQKMRVLLSFGCNWKTVKDWKNPFLAAIYLDRDAFNTMIPYLGKQFSVLLIGRLETLAWL